MPERLPRRGGAAYDSASTISVSPGLKVAGTVLAVHTVEAKAMGMEELAHFV